MELDAYADPGQDLTPTARESMNDVKYIIVAASLTLLGSPALCS
jgi:hypothetical protein